MCVSETTITRLLNKLNIAQEFRHDPELRAIVYGFARLEEPVSGVEARFLEAWTLMSADCHGGPGYFIENRMLMKEIYIYQLGVRLDELSR